MPFVRVAGCNLACSWCDSSYTWKGDYAYSDMTAKDIMDRLPESDWVSITGGEPTLYRELADLVRELDCRYTQVLVETNGLHCPDWLLAENVTVSCSPKLPNSGQDTPERRQKVKVSVARLLSQDDTKIVQFKFVISGREDMLNLLPYCESVGIPTDPITDPSVGPGVLLYLQPDGYIQPVSQYLEALRWLQENAPPHFRVTPQVHRLVHGPNAKGV